MKAQSIEQLLDETTTLSLRLAYKTTDPNGNYFDVRDDKRTASYEDLIFEYADGLYHKWIKQQIYCQCSLSSVLDFDLFKEEKRLKNHIRLFKRLLKKVGEPRKMTKEEMIGRGYKY